MFQGLDYVPLLHARLAEIRALEGLETFTRARIFPVIRLRPWFNAASLERAFEVIEGAIGEGFYGLDLDATRRDINSAKPAVVEFNELFDPDLGFENYYETVRSGQYRVPVFREVSHPSPQITAQLEHVEQIDRGLIVRVPIDAPGVYIQIAEACVARGIVNTAFIFDCGWKENALDQIAVTAGLVNSLLDVTEQFEVSVASSTFPDKFAGKGVRFSQQIADRQFFEGVRAQVNRGQLTYGDWGSTRTPSEGGFARNTPRIDMADAYNWMFWRSDGEENYQQICERVINDDLWDGNLDAWGKYMIESTALGGDNIRSAVIAAAVRVNLHLISQAHLNDPEGYQTPDTPIGSNF